MILDLHHRHSAEGSTEVQGNAPLLSVTRGEKGTPESSYPLSHIRQDERAGRDSQEAFAQGASKKGGGRFPRDDNRGATRRVPASNPRRSDSESHPSRSSSRRGMAHPSPSREIPHSDNREATRTGPFEPNPRGARVVRNPGPVLSLPSSAAKNQPTADRTAKSTSGGSGPVASSRSTRFHMLSARSNFPLSSL